MSTAGILFPGQGSQSVGMLGDLADAFPVVTQTFAEASETLGYDLWALAQQGPEEQQRETRFTQPLMYASGVALWRVWQERSGSAAGAADSLTPVVMAGHSLGEFAALTAAGAISFSDGVALVKRRAELMSEAVPAGEGGMAALLGLDDDAVVSVCQNVRESFGADTDRVLEAVNFNAPGQVAVSGHVDALQRLVEQARDHGARKAVMLPVSVPNHSSLMQRAGEQLADAIDALQWQQPAIPVMQNASVACAESVDAMLAALKPHVYSPVFWTRSVAAMIETHKVTAFVELGPGKVLAGLGKRIDKSVPVHAVADVATLDAAIAALTTVEA